MLRVVAKYFGVSKTRVSILKGVCSREKILLVEGVAVSDVLKKFKGL